jgi:glycogen(starch) synthase
LETFAEVESAARSATRIGVMLRSSADARVKMPLRILMLTWEYPPRIVGGISRVVEGLSKSLVKLGAEIHVITTEMPGSPLEENDDGVFIHRVGIDSPAPNFHSWVLLMNHFFSKRAGRLAREVGGFDIVHVHDWLVLPSGAEVKSFLGCKMVSTLHSLEFKRAGEPNSPEGKMVESLEWWITYESSLIIVCSGSMKQDTHSRYKAPDEKIWVIPIGIDTKKFQRQAPDRDVIRARYRVSVNEKLILFVGRLTHQKGCEYLIRAIPSAAKHDNVKLVIVGDGYQKGELEYVASQTGESWRIRFTGFLPDGDVVDLMLSADVMVIPSVYEPFGVVALEALAAGVPVVASDVDGLGEIIKHEYNGILVYPRDSSSISWGISRILSDRLNTLRMVQNGKNDITRKYAWESVAELTLKAYHSVWG